VKEWLRPIEEMEMAEKSLILLAGHSDYMNMCLVICKDTLPEPSIAALSGLKY